MAWSYRLSPYETGPYIARQCICTVLGAANVNQRSPCLCLTYVRSVLAERSNLSPFVVAIDVPRTECYVADTV